MRPVLRTPVLLGLLLALALAGCSAKPAAKPAAPAAEKPATVYEANTKTLETFFDATKKSGEFKSATVADDGVKGAPETAKFWIDGRRFRIEYFTAEGKKRIAIVSPDGQSAYFVDPDKKQSRTAVASVDHYISQFTRPSGKLEDAGKDAATGYDQLRYVVKKTDDIKGAANAWYTEDYVYRFKDGELVGIVSRGNTLENGKVKAKMDTFTYEFTKLETAGEIPASTFELEFPAK